MIRVAVFDDHPLFRQGVVLALTRQPDMEVVAEGSWADEAMRFADEAKFDVLLIGESLLGREVDARCLTRDTRQALKTIIFADGDENLHMALTAGISGYVTREIGGSELAEIVCGIARGFSYTSPDLAAGALRRSMRVPLDSDTQLTEREVEILGQAGLGLTNKEIARQLQLSGSTIKYYMASIMQKLQARNRIEAIQEAHRLGLLH